MEYALEVEDHQKPVLRVHHTGYPSSQLLVQGIRGLLYVAPGDPPDPLGVVDYHSHVLPQELQVKQELLPLGRLLYPYPPGEAHHRDELSPDLRHPLHFWGHVGNLGYLGESEDLPHLGHVHAEYPLVDALGPVLVYAEVHYLELVLSGL